MAYGILLLTGAREAPHLTQFIRAQRADLEVRTALTKDALVSCVAEMGPQTRLISFLTDIIVSADILNGLAPTPYNIHPGPPEYPGSKPEAFALYAGAKEYGATAHEMAARVDAGPIVHVERFAIDPDWGRLDLGDRAYAAAISVFAHVARHCAEHETPLPPLELRWGRRKTTNKDFRALCARPAETIEELIRLRRACGEDYEGRGRDALRPAGGRDAKAGAAAP